jgi:dihydroorotase
LNHRAVEGYDTNTKMNPPLRTSEDVEAIRKGLAEGVLDVIATDHAPHSPLEKDVEFDKADFGIIGLETVLPLTLSLVRSGVLSLVEAVSKLSTLPATILGVEGGRLEEGGIADVTIIDPEEEYVLQKEDIQSKSKNSPFLGMPMKGRAVVTIVGGKVVWKKKPEDSRR